MTSMDPQSQLQLGHVIASDTEFGWQARLNLHFVDRGDKTVLKHRSQQGPLTVQRPLYPEGNPCHTYLLHPPGGVVGGDTLHIQVNVAQGAHSLITTPGATKFYRSNNQYAKQQQVLVVEKDAYLEWLPQENIFFPDSHVRADTQVYLHQGARFVGWEMHCLGRPALTEVYSSGHIIGKTKIFIDDQLVITEGVNIQGQDTLLQCQGMLGYQLIGTLYIAVDDEHFLSLVQTLLSSLKDDYCNEKILIAASQLEHVLVIRALGNYSEHMLQCFTRIWQLARKHYKGNSAHPPRIWAT